MRVYLKTGIFITLTCVLILALSSQDVPAKGPKGKGAGGGGSSSHARLQNGSRSGVHSGRPNTDASQHYGSWKQSGDSGGGGKSNPFRQATGRDRLPATDSYGENSHPWSMQRAKEQQKLDHRLDVADKLDRIAEQNGNPNLHDTAARKREKASQLYEKRMTKIDDRAPGTEAGDEWQPAFDSPENPTGTLSDVDDSDLPAPGDDPVTASQKLTGLENALSRQLENEQRKLVKQMETAERLWDAYEQTGDEQLANLAQAFEERALWQYQKRMEAIRSFQNRHGLPDMIGDSLISDNPFSGFQGEQSGTLVETLAPFLP